MSAVARPIGQPYLRTGCPAAMARSATLCPRGIGLDQRRSDAPPTHDGFACAQDRAARPRRRPARRRWWTAGRCGWLSHGGREVDWRCMMASIAPVGNRCQSAPGRLRCVGVAQGILRRVLTPPGRRARSHMAKKPARKITRRIAAAAAAAAATRAPTADRDRRLSARSDKQAHDQRHRAARERLEEDRVARHQRIAVRARRDAHAHRRDHQAAPASRPDPQARGLAFRRSFLIGLVYDNPNAPYVINVQEGALGGAAPRRLRAGRASLRSQRRRVPAATSASS